MGNGSGKLAVKDSKKSEKDNTSTTEVSFSQAQTPVKNNLPVSVNLRKQFNTKSTNEHHFAHSIIKIGNLLVLSDSFDNQLLTYTSDGTDIDTHHIPLSTPLIFELYSTVINSETVAVSNPDNKIILLINIYTGSVTGTINTSGFCRGISYDYNNLYVVIDSSVIHVMDLTGRVIRTFPLPSHSIEHCIVDRDRLVCTDFDSIYCCSLNGKLIWQFTMDNFLDLGGLTTDNEGNVYVTYHTTHSVVVVSDDCNHYKEILTNSDGLDDPHGIYFDKQENILLVCNWNDGNVFLFDVKRKST